MARGRLGGNTGYAVALVIVSIFFVLSLLLAIVFSTQISDAQHEAQQAVAKLDEFVKPAERQQDKRVQELLGNREMSVVGQLLAESRRKSQLITGSEQDTVDAILKAVRTAGLTEGRPLLSDVQSLKANLNAEQAQIEALKNDLNEAVERAKRIEAEKTRLDQAYRASVDRLQGQIGEIQSGAGAYQASVDQQRQTLEARIEELQNRYARDTGELQAQVQQLNAEITLLRQRLAERSGPANGAGQRQGPRSELIPDGTILTVVRDAPLVYIDIGHSEHVLLGMTFEVYDKGTGIVADDSGDVRGKATIEVVRVGDGSSLARVVRRVDRRPIFEGDLIGNVAFDPRATLKFHVFGEFDVDRIGQGSSGDRRRIEAMVSAWGGVISPDLNYDVDFLVLGLPPELPEPLPRDTIDPVKIAEHAEMTRRFEQYNALLTEARRLSIPVLNQNRFLSMVGYYRR